MRMFVLYVLEGNETELAHLQHFLHLHVLQTIPGQAQTSNDASYPRQEETSLCPEWQ